MAFPREPLCQLCARHRETARSAPKQQSAQQQSAHTRHITLFAATLFRPEESPGSWHRSICQTRRRPAAIARNLGEVRMQIQIITDDDNSLCSFFF